MKLLVTRLAWKQSAQTFAILHHWSTTSAASSIFFVPVIFLCETSLLYFCSSIIMYISYSAYLELTWRLIHALVNDAVCGCQIPGCSKRINACLCLMSFEGLVVV